MIATTFTEAGLEAKTAVRVALCTSGEIWGGIEQCVETLSRQLHDRGIPVLVIVLHEGLLRERLVRAGIPVVLSGGSGPYDLRSIYKVSKVLREHSINVLHTHGYRATVVGAIAARLSGVRLVRTEHGSLEQVRGSGRVKRVVNIALERFASRNMADAVIFVSNDISRASKSVSPAIPQTVIYNGIEEISVVRSGESLEDFEASPELFKIGIVGRIVPIKGHEWLLRALAQLPELDRVRLYVFGTGPLEDECRALCSETGLNKVVRFMGFKKNIHEYIAGLDVLVMPSLHEGLPYTLLEAMALGVPVVASNVGGLAEVLENGDTGLLVPSQDVAALARAIDQVRSDASLRATLARGGRRAIAERFSSTVMVERHFDVYEHLLSGRKTRQLAS